MNFNKKALQTHLLVLGIVSIVMTVLLMSVLSTFFKNDNPNCQKYQFETPKKCVDGKVIKVDVRNLGESIINFKSDSAFTRKYQVAVNSVQPMEFGSQGENVKLIPFVKDAKGDEFDCTGKTEEILVERLMKCP